MWAGSRRLKLRVNGAPSLVRQVANSGGWTTPVTLALTTEIPAGRIVITSYYGTDPCANIDGIAVS